ncbi:MAG: chemotaxis protein CheA, partial [Clostridiales bacterium]|nr:chemotaxis protein CheA [Clostridiales bacterium]
KGTAASQLVEESIRVNLNLLNDLMNLASELVLGRNRLLSTMEVYSKEIPGLDAILQDVDHITTEMQEKVMQTRMQPVRNIFNKFPRFIRDVSRDLNKEMELTMEGMDVELDKSIIESLGDPLTHLVRNAADHGIEKPEIREQLGKPRKGNIHLHAYHEGGHVAIDIIDDGAGIDAKVIRDKAVEKGIINQAEAEGLEDADALLLLFAPGFSTAEAVTDVSGRGVGMDVVKTNIEKLGGSIEIYTEPGKGTTFRLTLPLTLAIISSLIVRVSNQRFALPQINLQEMVRIKPGDETRRIEYINDSRVLRLRGNLLPLIYLSDVLGLPKDGGPEEAEIIRVLVLKLGSKRFGLVVDSIQDDEEILVKPLPRYIGECRAYSGVTIMGDGSIALILDPQGIVEAANLNFATESYNQEEEVITALEEDAKIQDMLLFQAAGPEMLSVHLSEVARVDEIDIDTIEYIGNREYINYRGRPLLIIRPENYLPIQNKNRKYNRSYIIIPKHSDKYVGILISKLYDTIHDYVHIDDRDIKGPGIYGTMLIDGKVAIVVCIKELIEMAHPDFQKGSDSL